MMPLTMSDLSRAKAQARPSPLDDDPSGGETAALGKRLEAREEQNENDPNIPVVVALSGVCVSSSGCL